MSPAFMDRIQAPSNPCSLETIPEPIALPDKSLVWPLMLSCYQLEDDGKRTGNMELYMVSVPDIAGSNLARMPLKFGDPIPILQSAVSGILDGRWHKMPSKGQEKAFCFATAHSSGEMRLHSLTVPFADDHLESQPLFTTDFLGRSDAPLTDNELPPLCLSLCWDSPWNQEPSDMSTIVSTYSNGTVAIHDVAFLSDRAELIERDSWQAHSIFTSPAEVWSACFVYQENQKIVVSCGDEGAVKLWDVRSTLRPMQVLQPFAAGATCAASHPRIDHIIAVGSYDETICYYDARKLGKPLVRTKELGGGIWRIKWHPFSDDRVLVSAMHGGCRVLRVHGIDYVDQHESVYSAPLSVKVKKEFTEHDSMAYGADWLVCKHPTRNGYFEAAASCSFYDRAVFTWDSIF